METWFPHVPTAVGSGWRPRRQGDGETRFPRMFTSVMHRSHSTTLICLRNYRIWLLTLAGLLLWLVSGVDGSAPARAVGQTSLQFFGAGAEEPGRVRIPLGPLTDGRISSSAPVNVSGDFTIEFWMKATAADNPAPACPNGWYYGHIIIDRDVDGPGDYGDYGIALCDGRLAAGVSVGEDDRQLLSSVVVADGEWRHIALTRSDGGLIALFVDGMPAGGADGPAGPIDYRPNRETGQPDSDPYLVLGAEKHGYPGSYHYTGLLDDLRISSVVRYSGPFNPPSAPHPVDAQTVALYRFDEGSGAFVGDSSGAAGGPSHGILIVAGSPAGPVWSTDTPFTPTTATPTATGAVATASAESGAPVETAAPIEATPAPPIVTVVPLQSAPMPPTEDPNPTVSATPTERPAPVATVAPPASAAADARGRTMTEAPPPASGITILVLAWISAAVIIGLAIAVRLRQRTRRM